MVEAVEAPMLEEDRGRGENTRTLINHHNRQLNIQ
jgi:hypothetical protein